MRCEIIYKMCLEHCLVHSKNCICQAWLFLFSKSIWSNDSGQVCPLPWVDFPGSRSGEKSISKHLTHKPHALMSLSNLWFIFNCVIYFSLLSCSSFCVLNINSLPNIWFINIFFNYISCLFTLLILSFAALKFLFLM